MSQQRQHQGQHTPAIASATESGYFFGASFDTDAQHQARRVLEQHKSFFRTLCDTTDGKAIAGVLAGANDSDLNALAYFIYLLHSGHIGLAQENQNRLLKRRKYMKIVNTFRTKHEIDYFCSLSRADKLRKLRDLGIGLAIVVRVLFYTKGEEVASYAQEQQQVDAFHKSTTFGTSPAQLPAVSKSKKL